MSTHTRHQMSTPRNTSDHPHTTRTTTCPTLAATLTLPAPQPHRDNSCRVGESAFFPACRSFKSLLLYLRDSSDGCGATRFHLPALESATDASAANVATHDGGGAVCDVIPRAGARDGGTPTPTPYLHLLHTCTYSTPGPTPQLHLSHPCTYSTPAPTPHLHLLHHGTCSSPILFERYFVSSKIIFLLCRPRRHL